LLDDEIIESADLAESMLENASFNPFETLANFMQKDSNEEIPVKTEANNKLSRISLLSLIFENGELNLNLLENKTNKRNGSKLKIDAKICDILLVDKLFTSSDDLKLTLLSESKEIPLHPKLFDQKNDKYQNKVNNCYPNIQNIMKNYPERVIMYSQQGIKHSDTNKIADFIELNLFIVMKETSSSLSTKFDPSDLLVNLYKSLDTKLTFKMFWDY